MSEDIIQRSLSPNVKSRQQALENLNYLNMTVKMQRNQAGVLNSSNGRWELELRRRRRNLRNGLYDDDDLQTERELLYNRNRDDDYLFSQRKNTTFYFRKNMNDQAMSHSLCSLSNANDETVNSDLLRRNHNEP